MPTEAGVPRHGTAQRRPPHRESATPSWNDAGVAPESCTYAWFQWILFGTCVMKKDDVNALKTTFTSSPPGPQRRASALST